VQAYKQARIRLKIDYFARLILINSDIQKANNICALSKIAPLNHP
jgi:hypothetical protein